jgi:hypothetical protein
VNEEECEINYDDMLLDERGNHLEDVRLGDCNDRFNPSGKVTLRKRTPHLADKEGEEVKKQF